MWIDLLLIAWFFGPTWSQRTQMNTVLSHGTSFEGQARIICGESSIGIELSNVGLKDGRLFARKFSNIPNCVKQYTSNDKTIRLDIPFNYLSCGIKSRRMTQPRSGTEYSMTVILSYGQQLTEDDQMFSLSCRYFSNRREIGTVMEVSTFSKSYLVGGRNGPSCEYTLHYNSLNGPTAENARIGDKVYHLWKCSDSSFALKIYDCYVHDGNNKKYKLLDEQGCSKDKTILPELTYDPSLNSAFAMSRVFKFASAAKIYFNCLLYMCPKSDPLCRQAVPPKCNNNGKQRRSILPTVGPARLFTVNSSLPFDQHSSSTKSFEQLSETDDDHLSLDSNLMINDQTLEPLESETKTHFVSTTTAKPVNSLKESKSMTNEDKTAILLPAPVIEFQPISSTLSSCSAQTKNSIKVVLVGLVACNVILLVVSTISIAALCKRHTTARLDLVPSYSSSN